MSFIPKVMEYDRNDTLLLRWMLNYEELFPDFEAFRAALGLGPAAPRQTVEEVEADVAELMEMDWEVSDGKRN